ncbi:hypothetical protein Tco_1405490 [Tanacetum coccineum]
MPVNTAGTVQEVNKDKGKGIMIEYEPEQTKTKLQQRQERAGYEAARLSFDEHKALFDAGASMPVSTASTVQEVNKDKGKGIMTESEPEQTKTNLQQRQERAGYEAVVRLQEQLDEEEETKLPQEDLQQMMMVVPVEEVYVEALQVKYPIIDWEVYSEDTRRDHLVKLWDLVKERFSTTEPTDDKEKELWVEVKRLFQPDSDDTLWKLQRERLSIIKRSSDVDVGYQAISRTTFRDGK